MKRKEYQSLVNWKNKAGRKPLLVIGVRQCGKTFLVFYEIQDCLKL